MSNEPRTAAEWLALGDEELGMELAKRTPEPWKHCGTNVVPGVCNRCGNKYSPSTSCIVPRPIDINWKTAKYYESFAMDKDPAKYATCLKQLYPERGIMIWETIALDRDCRKRLIAAAMAQAAKE